MTVAVGGSATYTANTGTSHALNLPGSIAKGDLIVLYIGVNSNAAVTHPDGWARVLNHVFTDGMWIFAKIADGSEGATLTITTASTAIACAAVRYTGANGTSPDDIFVSTAVDAAGAPDPPSASPPSGSLEYLWVALTYTINDTSSITGWPTNYTDTQLDVRTSVGGTGGTGVQLAHRLLTASSEDPGAFTASSSVNRSTYTLAIRPAVSRNLSTYGVGAASSNTSTATLVTGSTVDAAVGDFLVAIVAADNNGTNGAASLASVSDSGGNTWTQRALINNDPGLAAAGATLGIFVCEGVTSALTNGTVTANFSPNTTAKGLMVFRVEPASGYSLQFVASDTTGATGTNSGAGNAATVSNGDLVFAALANENRNAASALIVGDTDTTDGYWSALYAAGIDSGSAATSMWAAMQYKFCTAGGSQTFNFTTASDWAASYYVVKAVANATSNFGWYEQIRGVPATSPPLPNYNSYTRDLRPGINFTTPTPTNLEWFVPYAKLPPVPPRPWSAIAWTPNAPAVPNIGWFEPYARLPIAGKAPAVSSFAMAPVNITPPPFGWFEPFAKTPPIAKPPASSIAMDPQAIAPPQTLTTDLGWFSPYAKPGPPPPQGVSSIAMDPQPIGAPQTLTTDLGWFTPYTVLPKSAWKPPRNSFSWTSLAITAPPFGWFEAYARRAPIGPVARGSVAIAPPQPTAVVTLTTEIGWFEPYSRLPAKLLRPYSSIVLPVPVTSPPVPPVVPVPTGGGWKEIPRPSFDHTVKVHWAPIEVYAWTAFVVEPVFITPPRWPEKPVQAIFPAPALTPPTPAPIASPEKPLPPPETVLAGWVAASVDATVAFRGAIVDMRPVAAAKRRKMAAYVEAAQEHDRKLIREWLEARGVKL